LEQVQLKEYVNQLEKGLESEVKKSGCNFSVGQKQLICLARAMAKNSKILLIDEATSNVDHE
jgi:ABC-type multidrug transport system fused ATPase/permease subunit